MGHIFCIYLLVKEPNVFSFFLFLQYLTAQPNHPAINSIVRNPVKNPMMSNTSGFTDSNPFGTLSTIPDTLELGDLSPEDETEGVVGVDSEVVGVTVAVKKDSRNATSVQIIIFLPICTK